VEAVRILIEPNDVLLFRESKPFLAGEGHLARSVFPLPQAIAGAIRSKILVDSNFSDEAKKFVGFKAEEPEFEILGLFIFKGEEYFPTPLDVAEAKGIDSYFFVEPLPLKKWNRFIFKGKTIHFKRVGGFLSYKHMVDYLKGSLKESELEDIVKEDLIKRESRVGIKLRDAKTTEEGFFYKAEFLRFGKNVKLSVWFRENGEKVKEFLGEKGLIKLGGESRFAKFEFDNKNPLDELEKAWDEIKQGINRRKRFKLYVATQLLIRNGNSYTWSVKALLEKDLNISIKNVYSLIGKPLTFSGWDYAENKPKPNRYAVPSGSVYFVEFDGKIDRDEPYLKLGGLTKLGYGLCFMGVW
jgi:CRISPR-associated protein Cmr3